MLYNIGTSTEYASNNGHQVWHYIYSDSSVSISSTTGSLMELSLSSLGNNLYGVSWGEYDRGDEDTGELYKSFSVTVTNGGGEQLTFSFNEYMTRATIVPDDDSRYIFAGGSGSGTVYFTAYNTSGTFTVSGTGCVTSVGTPVKLSDVSLGAYYSLTYSTSATSDYGAIAISATSSLGDGTTFTRYIAFSQARTIVFPCWKDTYYHYTGSEESVEYVFENADTEEEFFRGKAYSIDGTIDIPVNKIAQSYLYSDYNPVTATKRRWVKDENASLYFNLKIDDIVVAQYFTWLDYSYDENELVRVGDTIVLNNPVRRTCESNGYIVFSVVNTAQSNDYITIEGEKFGNIFYDDPVADGKMGLYHLTYKDVDMNDYPPDIYDYDYYDYKSGDILYHKYKFNLDSTCRRYQLLYKNNYGGYDTFLVEGRDKQTDSWTNYSIKKDFKNTEKGFRTQHYLKDVTTKQSLYTGWLTDEQSLRMDNLLESTMVYLCDLEEDTVIPVVITDTSWEKKTYGNQGKKLVAYAINVEYSQNKIRR